MSQKLSPAQQLIATYITLNVICASLDIFWVYAKRDNESQLPAHVLDTYQRFIVFDREAHIRTAIVTLMTLFDTTRRTITLDRMVKSTPMDNALAQKLLHLLAGLKPRVKKIEKLRHNLYAHRNDAAVHNAVFAEAKLARNDLEVMVRVAIRITNRLAREMSAPLYIRHRDARDDFLRLLASAAR